MKTFRSLAPAVALLMAGGLLSACDNGEALEKLSGKIEEAKGEIAAATEGLGERLKQGMAKLDGKIAEASGRAEKAAAAAAANAGKAGAIDSATKSLGAALDEVKAQVAAAGAATETLGASVGKVTDAVGKNSGQIGRLAKTMETLTALLQENREQVGAVAGAAESLKAGLDKLQAQVGGVGDAVAAEADKAAAERQADPADGACPSLADTIARAAEQWPGSPHYALDDRIGRSFVAGYNRVRTGGEELLADTVVVFPMLKFDTWYVLAGLDGCFVFWTELAPDLIQKLMDNGPRGPVDPRDEEF